MVIKSLRFLFLGVLLVVGVLFSLNFVVADGSDCYAEEPQFGGDKASCNLAGCLWASNDSAEVASSVTDIYDEECGNSYCCFPNSCFQFDGNSSACTNVSLNGGLNCTWDTLESECHDDFFSGGEWGGMDDGCWNSDANENACTSGDNKAKCSWASNVANENPWCFIDSLTSAQMKNPLATSIDIGCCEQKSCWNYDNNESSCSLAFQGNCIYENNSYGGGWCNMKWCGEITDEANCSYVKQNLFMPCEWDGDSCEDSYGDGGFGFYNTTDSCFDAGGWYNSTGACVMPSGGDAFGSGGGGFLFGGSATCW